MGTKIRKFAFTHNIHTLSRAAYLLLGRIARITYVDAAYCYRPSSVVCRSVTLVSPAKMAQPIELPLGLRTWVGVRRGSRSSMGRGNFKRERGVPL